MHYNQIGNDGAKHLAEALQYNQVMFIQSPRIFLKSMFIITISYRH
jgi:hypothetical protein